MARKQAVKLDPAMVEFGKQFERDSPERKAWDAYVQRAAEVEVQRQKLADKKFEGKDGKIPDKHRDEFKQIGDAMDKAAKLMFGAFDNWKRLIDNVVTVPEKEARNIIAEALMSNADLVTTLAAVQRLERKRLAEDLAFDILDVLKKAKIKVSEDNDLEPEFCDDCLASVA